MTATIEKLNQVAPDIAGLVASGSLSLQEGLGLQEERAFRNGREVQKISLQLAVVLANLDREDMQPAELARHLCRADPDKLEQKADLSGARALRAAAVLMEYARLKEGL